jgi:hypothetical protein
MTAMEKRRRAAAVQDAGARTEAGMNAERRGVRQLLWRFVRHEKSEGTQINQQ